MRKAILPIVLSSFITFSCELENDILPQNSTEPEVSQSQSEQEESPQESQEENNQEENNTEQNQEEETSTEEEEKEVSFGSVLTAHQATSFSMQANLKYGNNERQNYDMYLPDGQPAGVKAVPVVVIHGGGWSLLDKSFMKPVVDELKKQGLNIAIFNINHRLAGSQGVDYAQIMADINQFMAHLDGKKATLNLTDEVLLLGYSSGGHLALSYAYQRSNPNIKAVAAIAAPTDLTMPEIHNEIMDDKNRNLTQLLIGASYQENPGAYEAASPYFDVNGQSEPTILFYGDRDELVDQQTQGKRLHTRLRNNGVKAQFHLVSNATHDMNGKMPVVIPKAAAFWKSLQ
ncbi:alpha/beta hydrolase fold domain-containing protein [Jiulongibacter sp. NS-SX5]|uniref:alpha/beta hydrolase fold domain-containing protein n=1 Tax=Jiulongibacter sp. NS-SX5 TaxID=3463854 RepID=UPI004059BF53